MRTSGKGCKGPEEEVLALPPHSKLEKIKDPLNEDPSEKLSRFGENSKRKR